MYAVIEEEEGADQAVAPKEVEGFADDAEEEDDEYYISKSEEALEAGTVIDHLSLSLSLSLLS